MLSLRAFFSISILILINFGRVKHLMIDSLAKKDRIPLLVRITSGFLSSFVNFTAIKYFDLTLVTMVASCTPLIALGLAYFILGERIFLV